MLPTSILCDACRAASNGSTRAAHYGCVECAKREISRQLELYRQFGGDEVVSQIKNELYEEWTREA